MVKGDKFIAMCFHFAHSNGITASLPCTCLFLLRWIQENVTSSFFRNILPWNWTHQDLQGHLIDFSPAAIFWSALAYFAVSWQMNPKSLNLIAGSRETLRFWRAPQSSPPRAQRFEFDFSLLQRCHLSLSHNLKSSVNFTSKGYLVEKKKKKKL